jgi:hypothetical protein
MPDPKDLNSIYDPNGVNDPVPVPKVKPRSLDELHKGVMRTYTKAGTPEEVDVSEYIDYMPGGVYTTRKPIDFIRGENQTVGEKLWRRTANLIPNIAAGLVEGVGYLGALATEWGDDKDYSNWLTQGAAAMKNSWAGDTYRESNDVWDIGDPTWWIDNVFSLAETATTFAIGGMGASAVLGKAASTVGKLAQAGQLGTRALNAGAKLGTAGYLAFTEGAMSGAKVYDQVFDDQFKKHITNGLTPEEAKERAAHTASQSAATTVQLNTILNTGLNLTSISPFFRKADDVVGDIMKQQMRRQAGETLEDVGKRVAALEASTFGKQLRSRKGYLAEMGQESLEELTNQFAEQTGIQEGTKGRTHGFLEQLGQLENYFARTMNEEGALAATLGAFGGFAQTAITYNMIPSRSVEKLGSDGQALQRVDKDGNFQTDAAGKPVYQKKRISARSYDNWMMQQHFSSVKDAVANEIDNFTKLQNELAVAAAKGDSVEVSRIKQEMFDIGQIAAVRNGLTEPWIATYNDIAEMDQAEAVKKGLATDDTDEEFRAKAKQAGVELKEAQQEYQALQKKYGTLYEDNAGMKQVVDMVFARKIELKGWDKQLKEHDEKLKEIEKERDELAKLSNPEDYDQHMAGYVTNVKASQEVNQRLKADLEELQSAAASNDIKKIKRLLKKYRAVGVNDSDLQPAVDDLVRKLVAHNEKLQARVKEAEDTLFNSSGFTAWQAEHPEGKFETFMQEVVKNYSLDSRAISYKASIDESRKQHAIASQNLGDILKTKGLQKFASKAKSWNDRIMEEAENLEKVKLADLQTRAKDKATLRRIDKIQLDAMAQRYKDELDKVEKRITEVTARIAEVRTERESKPWRAWDERKILRREELQLKKELEQLIARKRKLETLYHDSHIDTSTTGEMPVPVGEVTKENDELGEEETPSEVDPLTEIENSSVPAEEATEPVKSEADRLIEEALADAPVAEVTEEEQREDPEIAYLEAAMAAPKPVQKELLRLLTGIRDGSIGFSYDLLKQQVNDGTISQPDAAQLLQKLYDYIEATRSQEAFTQVVTEKVEEQKSNLPKVDVNVPGLPDSPAIFIMDDALAEELPGEMHHGGKKTKDVLSVANSTIKYREIKQGDKYRKVADPTSLSETTNPDVLIPGKLTEGHPVRFEVDTAYDGDINIDDFHVQDEYGERGQRKEKTADRMRAGRVVPTEDNIGSVAIKVVDTVTGNTIGYVRRLDWVTAKYPGTSDYRNVADTEVVNDTVIDIMPRHIDEIMSLRRKVIEQFNANGTGLEGEITGKGTGSLIKNIQVNLNTDKTKAVLGLARSSKPENSMLPDESLEIAVVQSGKAYTGKDYMFSRSQGFDTVDLPDGSVVVMLPGANGQYLYAPLVGHRLVDDQRKTAVNAVSKAIELYLSNDGSNPQAEAEILELQKLSGFDISTEQGLKAFINQYFTYSQDFLDSVTSVAAAKDSEEAQERFLFSIQERTGTQNKGNIKLGWSYSGRAPVYAKLTGGRLDPKFVEALEEGFATRSRAVVYTNPELGIRGINSSGSFTEIYADKNGKFKPRHFPSYNEYVKSFSRTIVYGRNQIGDRYVYTANPSIPFAVKVKPVATNLVVKQNETPDKVQDNPELPYDAKAANMFDLDNEYRSVEVSERGTAPDNARELSVQTLTEIYNFTPVDNRNGKTVLEVYEDLLSRGHSFIPDGFNPFTRCL